MYVGIFRFTIVGLLLYCSLLCASQVYERELLITGCARSGTTYICNLLTEAGYPIDHERIGEYGLASWFLTVPCGAPPWGPPWNKATYKHIFHQVRHPVLVISSVYTSEPARSWDFIMKHISEIAPEDTHTTKCAKYWYYWNLKAAKLAEWTYCIEDIDHLWEEFKQRLGANLDTSALEHISRTTNRRGGAHKVFTWAELEQELDPILFHNIQQLALTYGYKTKD